MIVHKEGVWLSLKCIDENLKELAVDEKIGNDFGTYRQMRNNE
jgi:hypothetical protein